MLSGLNRRYCESKFYVEPTLLPPVQGGYNRRQDVDGCRGTLEPPYPIRGMLPLQIHKSSMCVICGLAYI